MPSMAPITVSDNSSGSAVSKTFSPVQRYADTGVAVYENLAGTVPGERDSLSIGVPASKAGARKSSVRIRARHATQQVEATTGRVFINTLPASLGLTLEAVRGVTETNVESLLQQLEGILKNAGAREAIVKNLAMLG